MLPHATRLKDSQRCKTLFNNDDDGDDDDDDDICNLFKETLVAFYLHDYKCFLSPFRKS